MSGVRTCLAASCIEFGATVWTWRSLRLRYLAQGRPIEHLHRLDRVLKLKLAP